MFVTGRPGPGRKTPDAFQFGIQCGQVQPGRYFNTNYFADPKEKIVAVLMKQTKQLSGDICETTFIRMMYQALDDGGGSLCRPEG